MTMMARPDRADDDEWGVLIPEQNTRVAVDRATPLQ